MATRQITCAVGVGELLKTRSDWCGLEHKAMAVDGIIDSVNTAGLVGSIRMSEAASLSAGMELPLCAASACKEI